MSTTNGSGLAPIPLGARRVRAGCARLGLDRGLSGTLVAPSAWFMKSPPQQIHDDVAHERVEAFIRGEDDATLTGTAPGVVEGAEAVTTAVSPEQEAVTIA